MAPKRVRSSSLDRASSQQARYWALLLQNLRRAVDDIYGSCEADNSVMAAKEAILVLDNYTRDLRNLVDWMRLQHTLENTPEPMRKQTSLAWEIRKTSPMVKKGFANLRNKANVAPVARKLLRLDDNDYNEHEEICNKGEHSNSEDESAPKECEKKEPSEREETKENDEVSRDEVENVQKDLKDGKGLKDNKDMSKETEISDEISTKNTEREKKIDVSEESRTEDSEKSGNKNTEQINNVNEEDASHLTTESAPANEGECKTIAEVAVLTVQTKADDLGQDLMPKTSIAETVESTGSTSIETVSLSESRNLSTTKERKSSATASTTGNEEATTSSSSIVEVPRVSTIAPTSIVPSSTTIATAEVCTESSTPVATSDVTTLTTTSSTSSMSSVKKSLPSKSSFSKVVSSNIPTVTSTSKRGLNTTKHQHGNSNRVKSARPTITSSTTTSTVVTTTRRPQTTTRISLVSRQSTGITRNATAATDPPQRKSLSSSWLSRSKTASVIEKTAVQKSRGANKMSQSLVVRPSSATVSSATANRVKTQGKADPKSLRQSILKASPKVSSNNRVTNERGQNQIKSTNAKSQSSQKQDKTQSKSKETNESKEASSSEQLKRSWADLVRGKVAEDGNLKARKNIAKSTSDKKERVRKNENSKDLEDHKINNDSEKSTKENKDDDGWHTVRPRLRQSRPQTRTVKESLLRRPAFKHSGFYYKDRFNKPSATTSLPSLAAPFREKQVSTSDRGHDDEGDSDVDKSAIKELKDGVEDEDHGLDHLMKEKRSDTKECTPPGTVDSSTQATSLEVDWSHCLPPPFSWADDVELEEALERSARVPGRAIQIHERLLSPASKKEPYEAFKEHERKMEEARMRREKIESDRAQKLMAQSTKIESVKEKKEKAKKAKRELFNDKMRKAEEKRMRYLDNIIKKAQEEEKKQKEIAFINELQAQNQRIDMLAHSQIVEDKHEERLASIAEERARKAGEREAKEARAEKQRRDMEQKREQSIQALREKIRSKEERIVEEQEQQRREREAAARLKEQDRIERLTSVRLAEKDQKEELQEKIAQKQEEAARRHQLKLDDVRRRAFELSVRKCASVDDSVPLLQPYNRLKKCVVCDVTISNEVELHSHLRGRRHRSHIAALVGMDKTQLEEHELEQLVDVSFEEQEGQRSIRRERQKAMRRRSKKLRNRLATKADNYAQSFKIESVLNSKFDAPDRGRIGKALREIEKLLNANDEKKGRRGPWPDNHIIQLDRCLLDICRCLNKERYDSNKNISDFRPKEKAESGNSSNSLNQRVFFHLEGFETVAKIIKLQRSSFALPAKTMVAISRLLREACRSNFSNAEHYFRSHLLVDSLDVLLERLAILAPSDSNEDDSNSSIKVDAVALAMLEQLSVCFDDLEQMLMSKPSSELNCCVQDSIGYLVSSGGIERLGHYLTSIRDPIESAQDVSSMIVALLDFLIAVAKLTNALDLNNDPTHLFAAFDEDIVDGTVSMLYAVLLHQGAPRRTEFEMPSSVPPTLPSHTCEVLSSALRLLQQMFSHDLTATQQALGREAISLEFRHIASHLLWYSVHHRSTYQSLLHRVIVLIGYFAADNADNQAILQSGQRPSVLQQLCTLPFEYFSKPELKAVLMPTLIAACHGNEENLAILTEEMSYEMLEDFKQSQDGKESELLKRINP